MKLFRIGVAVLLIGALLSLASGIYDGDSSSVITGVWLLVVAVGSYLYMRRQRNAITLPTAGIGVIAVLLPALIMVVVLVYLALGADGFWGAGVTIACAVAILAFVAYYLTYLKEARSANGPGEGGGHGGATETG